MASELDRAAIHARSRGGSDAAAELQLLAARCTPLDDPEAVQRRIVAAGGYFIQAGDPTRARAVLEEHVAGAPPGPGRADALRVLADARSSDDWSAKTRILQEALEEAGNDHRLRSQILEALAQTKWHTIRDARGEVALAMAAVAEAELQDDPIARCSAYLAAVFARLSAGDGLATDLLERAMALAPLVEHQRVFLWPAFARALTDAQCDRLDEGIATLLELRGRATAVGDWDSLPLIASNLARATFRRGAWHEARGHAVEAERGSRQNGQAEGLSFALGVASPGRGRPRTARAPGDGRRRRAWPWRGRSAGGRASSRTAPRSASSRCPWATSRRPRPSCARRWSRCSRRDTSIPPSLRPLTDRAEALVALDRVDEAVEPAWPLRGRGAAARSAVRPRRGPARAGSHRRGPR